MRILLVEDDQLLGDALKMGLANSGFSVDWAVDGSLALMALKTEHFDCVVLDIGLPKRSGLEVLKILRRNHNNVPVLFLTARDTIEDRVNGLDAGADDYITKPVDLAELCARIRVRMRRAANRSEPLLQFGKLTLNPAARTVEIDNEVIDLTRHEFVLLYQLLENVGKVITREAMTQALWDWSHEVSSNALEVHIHNLRKKVGSEVPIVTIRGIGYVVRKRVTSE